MATPLLATKLYIPPPQPHAIKRGRLIERLNAGLHHKLTLISAPAGFGKTTLLSEWLASCPTPAVWVSLDEGDIDPTRFLLYLVAALQHVEASVGAGLSQVLQSPQLPPIESLLTMLLNDIAAHLDTVILVLDDYHAITAEPIDQAFAFLIEHLPPQMHLVIATREDPRLPLARLRAKGHMTELRAADLRFTPAEAAEFLNQAMGLGLAEADIAALETRTEGWIAGLQLAALSLQGHPDAASFIQSFTGSHHFVLDYLAEEVLRQQPEAIQTFLLRTAILDRLCGPLCDAVLSVSAGTGQTTLEYLEHANLFIVPLDDERRWYRYHHLFADVLRQRLRQSNAASPEDAHRCMNELHIRASQWYEDHDFELDAFHHAAAANAIERAERLMEGKGIPLHLRGAVTTLLGWLAPLPTPVLDARPSLWWRYAALLLVNGQTTGVEEKLAAAEAALQGTEADDKIRDLIGQIAAARATLALTRYQADVMIAQSHRALEFLPAHRTSLRANAHWTLGYAYFYLGNRATARQAFSEAIALSQACGDTFTTILATCGLGNVQEAENQLFQAVESYQRILQLGGHQPLQIIYEAHLGLAHIFYEWNDLDVAEQHGQQSLHLAQQYDRVIDRFIVCEVFLARLKLAQGDTESVAALLAEANRSARQRNFVYRLPEIAAAQVQMLLHQGNVAAAAHIAQAHELPLSQARVFLAQNDRAAALSALEAWRQHVEGKGWADELLKALVLQALAFQAHGAQATALHVLSEALALAEPGGCIRTFVDEGLPMAQLLSGAIAQGMMPEYCGKLLAAYDAARQRPPILPSPSSDQPLIEPLSQREIEVLHLIAQGLSNQEISERLCVALDTVKGHNRRIFGKLQVQRRTEAVARARALGLL